MTTSTILVTGANGFLGAEIVNQLLTAGYAVRATGQQPCCFRPDVAYVQADITQPNQLTALAVGTTAVIHTAGLAHVFRHTENMAERFFQINELGAENMARAAAAAGVMHFILISSVSVYGSSTQGLWAEDQACHPQGPYAVSKRNAEHRAAACAKEHGMAVTILRLATLYGEGDPGNVARLMRSLDRGRFLWIGDGSNRKSLLYRGDAAHACVMAVAAKPAGSAIYNVSAPPCTMREIVSGLSHALGKKPLPVRIPAPSAQFVARLLARLPSERFARLQATIDKWLAEDTYNTRRIEAALGFHTQVGLIEGLQLEVQWYRQQQAR